MNEQVREHLRKKKDGKRKCVRVHEYERKKPAKSLMEKQANE